MTGCDGPELKHGRDEKQTNLQSYSWRYDL